MKTLNPEAMEITRKFFATLKKESYEAYISAVVLEEIGKCSEERQTELMSVIKNAEVKMLETNSEVEDLADKIVAEGIVPVKYDEDAFHIAIAMYYGMDYLASWNFNHIVKVKTKRMVSLMAIREGYRDIEIIAPREVWMMWIEEPKTMREIHRIQEQIHDEMKDLPPGERSQKINEHAREFMKKHNLNLEVISKH
jgi:hypothetical protein